MSLFTSIIIPPAAGVNLAGKFLSVFFILFCGPIFLSRPSYKDK